MVARKLSVCCRCNATGKCISCHCVKEGLHCTNCAPFRKGNCRNRPTAPSPLPRAQSSPPSSLNSSVVSDELSSPTMPLSTLPDLSDYPPLPSKPVFSWGSVDGPTFSRAVDDA
jgi:hypothetical protein